MAQPGSGLVPPPMQFVLHGPRGEFATTVAAAAQKEQTAALEQYAKSLVAHRERLLADLRFTTDGDEQVSPQELASALQELKGVSVEVVEAVVAWRASKRREDDIVDAYVETGHAPPPEDGQAVEESPLHAYAQRDPWGEPVRRKQKLARVPQFIWGGYNYLRKMLNDLDFLAGSKALAAIMTMEPSMLLFNPLMTRTGLFAAVAPAPTPKPGFTLDPLGATPAAKQRARRERRRARREARVRKAEEVLRAELEQHMLAKTGKHLKLPTPLGTSAVKLKALDSGAPGPAASPSRKGRRPRNGGADAGTVPEGVAAFGVPLDRTIGYVARHGLKPEDVEDSPTSRRKRRSKGKVATSEAREANAGDGTGTGTGTGAGPGVDAKGKRRPASAVAATASTNGSRTPAPQRRTHSAGTRRGPRGELSVTASSVLPRYHPSLTASPYTQANKSPHAGLKRRSVSRSASASRTRAKRSTTRAQARRGHRTPGRRGTAGSKRAGASAHHAHRGTSGARRRPGTSPAPVARGRRRGHGKVSGTARRPNGRGSPPPQYYRMPPADGRAGTPSPQQPGHLFGVDAPSYHHTTDRMSPLSMSPSVVADVHVPGVRPHPALGSSPPEAALQQQASLLLDEQLGSVYASTSLVAGSAAAGAAPGALSLLDNNEESWEDGGGSDDSDAGAGGAGVAGSAQTSTARDLTCRMSMERGSDLYVVTATWHAHYQVGVVSALHSMTCWTGGLQLSAADVAGLLPDNMTLDGLTEDVWHMVAHELADLDGRLRVESSTGGRRLVLAPPHAAPGSGDHSVHVGGHAFVQPRAHVLEASHSVELHGELFVVTGRLHTDTLHATVGVLQPLTCTAGGVTVPAAALALLLHNSQDAAAPSGVQRLVAVDEGTWPDVLVRLCEALEVESAPGQHRLHVRVGAVDAAAGNGGDDSVAASLAAELHAELARRKRRAEEEAARAAAASRIQARARGVAARERVQRLRDERRSEAARGAAASRIQARARGAAARKRVRRLRSERARGMSVDEGGPETRGAHRGGSGYDEGSAAVYIQAHARGMKDRRAVSRVRQERDAAVRMQAGARGMRDRRRVMRMQTEHSAAVTVQASVRGLRDRRRVSVIRREREAAIKVQAGVRGRLDRRRVRELRAEQAAAVKLQAGARGLLGRRRVAREMMLGIGPVLHGWIKARGVEWEAAITVAAAGGKVRGRAVFRFASQEGDEVDMADRMDRFGSVWPIRGREADRLRARMSRGMEAGLALVNAVTGSYDAHEGTGVLVCSPLRVRGLDAQRQTSGVALALASLVPGYTCKKRSLELEHDVDEARAGTDDMLMRSVSSLHVKESGHAPLAEPGTDAGRTGSSDGQGGGAASPEKSRGRLAPRRISMIQAEERQRPLSPHTSQNPLEFA